MNCREAESVLLYDTLDNNGAYTLLRMGKNPGKESVERLKAALRIIYYKYAAEKNVPREIVYSCGVILHFANECNQSTKSSSLTKDILTVVSDIQLRAFDVLAGDVAEQWIVKATEPAAG
jgi:hypothetical protein